MYIDKKRREKIIKILMDNICIHCFKYKYNNKILKGNGLYCNECSKEKSILDSGYKVFVCPICGIYMEGKPEQKMERNSNEMIYKGFLRKVAMYLKGKSEKKRKIIKTNIIGGCNYICFNCFSKDIDYLYDNMMELYKDFNYKRNQYVIDLLLQYSRNKNKN